ncbi:neither inactivation nor afterpotential protein G [Bombyx mandarina]|uniref:Neither inactivation nor afterpotential protein G n=1 Tax=Bombyx mandarina TaxID=7092 RepID=A0A6J2JAZ2_BOMMA|nr:neither inactivation nor afterpotential protein G [Bombyx mandarina]
MGYFTRMPLTPTAAQQGPNDWSVRTVPQRYSSFGLWRQTQILPRGKGLGGSGQINFLLHGSGSPRDYEKWSQLGFEGWTFEDLKPYFLKAFGTTESEFDTEPCYEDGFCPKSMAPMKLVLNHRDELMTTFKEASRQTKTEYTKFQKATATIKDGVRHVSFDAYLKPALQRDNLHVLLNTQGISIRFENKKAVSLYILLNHRYLNNVFINKDIIICAGAIKTPQILMLSGIGPKDLLQKLKIKPVVVNEHVGRNLHDHMNFPLYVSIQKPISVTLAKVFTATTVWEYLWKGKGLLSFPPVAGVEYQNPSAVMLFSMGTSSERLLRDLSNYKPQVFRATFPFHNSTRKEGFMFLSTCTQPISRGSVSLADANTKTPPLVDPRYLERIEDVRCMIQAIRRAEQLVSTKPFRDVGAKIHWPRPERCLTFWNYTSEDQRSRKRLRLQQKQQKFERKIKSAKINTPPDTYLECLIREVAVTGHHVAGTCSGGTVVDDQLQLKSVSGVRIMDASVLPAPLSLYPNSVLIAMAEKLSEMMRNNI